MTSVNKPFLIQLAAQLSHNPQPPRRYTILVEASKLAMEKNDGCKRYVSEITRGLIKHHDRTDCPWNLMFHIEGQIFNAEQLQAYFFNPGSTHTTATKYTRHALFKKARQVAKRVSHKMLREDHFRTLERWQYGVKMRKRNLTAKYYKLKTLLTPSKNKYDLIHLTLPVVPRFIDSNGAQFLTTIHDFTHLHYPQFHVSENILSSKKGIEFSEKMNSWWIAISNSTKKDLQKFCKVKEDKIFTIYEAADHKHFSAPISAAEKILIRGKYNIPAQAQYILSLSTLEPRKNIHNTIKAFHELSGELADPNLYLVISGRMGWMMEELLNDNRIKSDKIIFTGFVSEKDLPTLYADALALSYVSFYEGFGLPPLEAMSSGTPVIYGNNSSQVEIIGDSGIAAEPHSVDSIKAAMKKIITNEALRKEMQTRAKERAAEFSWEKCIEETVEAYKKVLGIRR